MKSKFTFHLTIVALFLFLQMASYAGGYYGNFYVKSTATGTGDGSSWTDAMTDLQQAIDLAADGDTICVAAGTYFPTHLLGSDTLRNRTFYIQIPVAIYGGFSGDPGTEGSLTDRNPKIHITTLSGDVGLVNDASDNAFHVVYFDHVSDSTRLDGFVIADGNSLTGGGLDGTGTGIFNDAVGGKSHPVIANCIIQHNAASESGGGMLNYAANGGHGNPLLINCTFRQNEASGGGGLSNYTDTDGEASPTFIRCSFMGNTARTADGGAINSITHSSTSAPKWINCIITGNNSPNSSAFQAFVTGTGIASPEFINCTFSGNTGGAIRVVDLGAHTSTAKIRNSIIHGNAGGSGISTNGANVDATFSIIPFGFEGEGVIGLDPLFVNQPPLDGAHLLGDVHLQDASPAIDAGRNEDVPAGTTTDLDGKPRFMNPSNGQAGIVDMGAYELQGNTTATADFLADTDWEVYPNPTIDKVVITFKQPATAGELRLLDSRGVVISSQHLHTGQHTQTIDASSLPSGIYNIHIVLDGLQDVKKISRL